MMPDSILFSDHSVLLPPNTAILQKILNKIRDDEEELASHVDTLGTLWKTSAPDRNLPSEKVNKNCVEMNFRVNLFSFI